MSQINPTPLLRKLGRWLKEFWTLENTVTYFDDARATRLQKQAFLESADKLANKERKL